MLGWLKRRQRREQLKLAKQNILAAQYIYDFASMAQLSRDPQMSELAEIMLGCEQSAQKLLDILRRKYLMHDDTISEVLEMNKNLRNFYDMIMTGKRQFARQFGSSSEPLLSFDKKFTPNEGWQIFFEHFEARSSF